MTGRKRRMMARALCTALLLSLFAGAGLGAPAQAADNEMYIGTGIGDITGPITEISTGYNSLGDVMEGILMRLYARAFIVKTSDESICYVSAEMVHMTESIKPGVIKELKSRGLGQYTEQNLMLAATHCHSSNSNVSWYPLYSLVNGVPGFDELAYEAAVKGIADAIENAHECLTPGTVSIADGTVENAVYNRSILAARQNADVADDAGAEEAVNKEMVLLRFDADDGRTLGVLDFFGSHGTSNSIDNTYISADHKGYAAYELEKEMGDDFVAAFVQSESGDSSPNEPQAADETADFLRPNQTDTGLDVIENQIVHGTKELDAARQLMQNTETLGFETDSAYTRVDFSDIDVDSSYIGKFHMPYDDPENASTSEPCIGAGIIAGDEEGAPVDSAIEGEVRHEYSYDEETGEWTQQPADFTKIDLSGLEKLFKPLWPTAMKILQSDGNDEAQAEKLVCLAVGKLMETVQPLQIFRIGELAIVGVPFELTCTQAQRTREVLEKTLADAGVSKVVFSTLTNSYSQYVTTREEYAAQHYEGATCLFGPWSGAALTQELDTLARAMVTGEAVEEGPVVEDKSGSLRLETAASTFGVVRDAGWFGKVLTDANDSYSMGETVSVTFQAASPRTAAQLKVDGKLSRYYDPDTYSYLEIQKKNGKNWETVRTDADPYTTFHWERPTISISAYSEATVGWLLKDSTIEPGTYRVVYNGIGKNLLGAIIKFQGVSGSFTIG